MQFRKTVNTSNKPFPHNGVHCCLWSGHEGKQNVAIYLEKLLFEKQIDSRHKNTLCLDRKKLEEKLKEFAGMSSVEIQRTLTELHQIQFVSDLGASQIKNLYENSYISERLIYDGLNCSRDLVINMGYHDFVADLFGEIIKESNLKNVMIIPGCQHSGMLSSRVAKAVKQIHCFPDQLTIIASGANPLEKPVGAPEKASIVSESTFILNKLNELIKKHAVKTPTVFEKMPENKSFKTEENIKESLELIDKNISHNLIIVSSTFHLIRLAKALEDELTKFHNLNPDSEPFIQNIFMFGSEDTNSKFTTLRRSGYIKSMFFDLFNELTDYQKKESEKNIFETELKSELSKNGYHVIKKGGANSTNSIIKCLGQIIQKKDICIDDFSDKRTNSRKRMRLHTDHPSAEYVIWHCIEPSSEGGETRLSDLSIIYSKLNDEEKELLLKSSLKNVKLLRSCRDTHSIVEFINGVEKFYFVPWFLQDNESIFLKELFKKIEDNAVSCEISFLLEKDDILVIDNKRILHGRSEITGSENRLLKRYWIKKGKIEII